MIDKDIRLQFPFLANNPVMQGHPLVYLDNASTTFKPRCVLDAIKRYHEFENANSHRGDYDICYLVDKEVASTRKKVAALLNAEEREIVFTTGTTNGLNLVAFGYGLTHLKTGDEIVLTMAEHASNLLPWFKVAERTGAKLRYIDLLPNGEIDISSAKKVIGEKTKVVSLAHVTNVLGFVAPIKEIAKLAHSVGAIMVVDGAQSVPHMKVDVKDLDCDFLAFSAHKMCGPTGIGALYGKYERLLETEPLLYGGGSNVKFYSNGKVELLPPPAKFEAGTLNLSGIYGFGAAADFVNSIGLDEITRHEEALKKYAMKRFGELSDIKVYNGDSPSGIIAFNKDGVFAQDEATYLNSRGIACRSGQHCAKILPEFLETVATVRASTYFYNTEEDIDALVDALKKGGDFLDAYF